MQKDLKPFLGKDYDKSDNKIYEILKLKGDEGKAINLAKRLNESDEIESVERNPLRNPSTDVFVLIKKLKSLLQ